jgi:anaerobic selenocysteine-containing dehydrogenase
MATQPAATRDILEQFGPHRAYAVDDNGAGTEAHRLVKTHCCFCGQQCGIQLKINGNRVIGFEPWEEFPFNRGMLCPKGVKRYLQGSHPDRYTHISAIRPRLEDFVRFPTPPLSGKWPLPSSTSRRDTATTPSPSLAAPA